MHNVFFNADVLTAEREIITSLKIPSLLLMENAGANSARYILANFSDQLKNQVIILSGKGNNAGDGFVIARHLVSKNIPVKIITLFREKELSGDALINFDILKNFKSRVLEILYCKDNKALAKEVSAANKLIIDCIFGVGFKGKLSPALNSIIRYVNELKNKTVISIDIPSGLHNYNQDAACINANHTLAMGVRKFDSLFYKGRESSGKISVMSIGVPVSEFTSQNNRKIFLTDKNDITGYLPVRKINSNKYSNGKVFVLAGSVGLTGAACLCSMAALRSGCGAVVTGTPKSVNPILENKMTEVMTVPLTETENQSLSIRCYDEITRRLDWADTVLIGPGLSKDEETLDLVRKIVRGNDLNYVIDADGIFAFRDNLNLLKRRKVILTPHFGEFSELTGSSIEEVKNNFYEMAVNFAGEYSLTLVLKNSPTIITNGKEFYINSTGRENLATAGTGDVLSGIIAGIFSQTGNAMESAVAGAYVHGKCGDMLYDGSKNTDSMIAGDLIDEISKVKSELSELEN